MAEFSDYVQARNSVAPDADDIVVIIHSGVAMRCTVSQLQSLVFGNIIENEVPTGDIDDLNTDFVISDTPISGSVKVYLNGVRMAETEDYTISGTTITFLIAPATDDTILIDYRT
jgi:hypothetical protein